MLHIILGILKFTGILLAVILLLVAAVILSVLFVPVRYRGKAGKTPEHTGAELRFSWLLQFIIFDLKFDLEEKKPAWTLRICGMTLERILDVLKKIISIPDSWKKKKKTKKTKITKKSKAAKTGVGNASEYASDKMSNDVSDDRSEDAEEIEETEEAEEETVEVTDDKNEETKTEEPIKESKADITADVVKDSGETCFSDDHSDTKERRKISTFVSEWYHKLLDLYQNLIKKIQDTGTSIRVKKDTIHEKVQSIMDKIQYYLGLGEKYEVKILFGDVLTELLCMLKHYGPARMKGYLHFGTGDPALTGELTGLIYLMLPGIASEFQVNPEFTEKVFETELVLKGKIRACHAVWLAWKLYRNKKLMRLIREFRKSRSS